MAKTQRIEMRADAESEERITLAASAVGSSVSGFVLQAARTAADRILARDSKTLMSADQFDQLMSSLDEPDPAPNLRKLAKSERRYQRQ